MYFLGQNSVCDHDLLWNIVYLKFPGDKQHSYWLSAIIVYIVVSWRPARVRELSTETILTDVTPAGNCVVKSLTAPCSVFSMYNNNKLFRRNYLFGKDAITITF